MEAVYLNTEPIFGEDDDDYENGVCSMVENSDDTQEMQLKRDFLPPTVATNPNFFYLLDLDEEGHLRNVLWADARSRIAYNYFCDTIMIDTTSLTNKYEIPLVSFVRVNHHGQSILLGCGFLGHESAEYFIWMLRAWLTCMLGRHPQVIVTNQSKPLVMAVSEVFPLDHHCYCVSYIMDRVPGKMGGMVGFEEIQRQLHKAVYDALKISELEKLCGEMINHGGE
ncbi:Protein FAR1-RELATED SEQUENCE 6 [Striga hermonthica]|uniref:Protein FAR1-RELATED SEQUENCE n=1 Tax=Striga hermonthica TaxID=68872 RepID=A0A9N7R8W8_STRHE|nr:Protein FAR1-RELATED SEQUENCE 6 [Striga hermonthica]